MKNLTEPIHPGEILADELEAIGMTAAALAVQIGVPKTVFMKSSTSRAA